MLQESPWVSRTFGAGRLYSIFCTIVTLVTAEQANRCFYAPCLYNGWVCVCVLLRVQCGAVGGNYRWFALSPAKYVETLNYKYTAENRKPLHCRTINTHTHTAPSVCARTSASIMNTIIINHLFSLRTGLSVIESLSNLELILSPVYNPTAEY